MPLLFNFAVDHAIRRVQVNKDGFQLKGTHQLLVILMILMYWVEAHILYKKTEALVIVSKETELELNSDKTKYMIMCRDQNAG
jgi:hypothetical protein